MNINVEKAKNGYIVCIGHEDRFVFQERTEMIKAVLEAISELDELAPDES